MFWKSGRDDQHGQREAVSLISMTGARLALAALISFIILSGLCLAENLLDEAYFERWYAKVEIAAVQDRLEPDGAGGLTLRRTKSLEHYWSQHAADYAFRVWDKHGQVVAGSNLEALTVWSPLGLAASFWPDVWQSKFANPWFHFSAGRHVVVNGQPLWIEVATRGDPDGVRYAALYEDFVHDVARPLLPTFLVAMVLALASLYRALRPVSIAASHVQRLEPTEDGPPPQIVTEGLPREVATLANAVNDLLSRTTELMNSQSTFIGRAAHQLRTPLATMLLEVGRIDGEPARNLERDIEEMSDTVDKLLELARMQGAAPFANDSLNLNELVDDVAMDLQSLADVHGAIVSVTHNECVTVNGDFVSLREALRNLVKNAIVHHPSHARVEIICGPGPSVTIDDDGAGLDADLIDNIFEPFSRGRTLAEGAGLGLALVKKVVELHRGHVSGGVSPAGGARFTIKLERAVASPHEASIPSYMIPSPVPAE